MAAKPRVHEIAHELGMDSKELLKLFRELGEFVKSPSSTVQPPAARKARDLALSRGLTSWTPGQRRPEEKELLSAAPSEESHPGARAARVRRELVARIDADWARYSFSAEERRRWFALGIPEDRAQLAAIARDSSRRANPEVRITANTLGRRLTAGDTVLEALLAGTNAIRLEERIAASRGGKLRGVNEELVAVTTSAQLMAEEDAADSANTFRSIRWEPSTTPLLADSLVTALSAREPRLRAELALREQSIVYQARGTVSPLLSAYARAHGVFHVGPELTRLCTQGILDDTSGFAKALDVVETLRSAASSRNFYFVREETLTSLEADDVIQERPPSPAGFVVVEADARASERAEAHSQRREIVAWAQDATGVIRCIRLTINQINILLAGKVPSAALETYAPRFARSGTAAAIVMGLAAPVLRRSDDAPRGEPATREPRAARLRDVVLHYQAPIRDGSGSRRGSRSEADHRWVVRGHWRRQWSPRNKTHTPIWIEQHTAGPVDRPLMVVERVIVR